MRVGKTIEVYSLKGKDIDRISEKIQEFLRKLDMESKNITRIRLSMEDILLDMRERFGEDVSCILIMGKQWGQPFIRMEVQGERFNPLEHEAQAEYGDWSRRLLINMGLKPLYLYKSGKNQILLKLHKKQINPVLKLVLAVVLAIALGILGRMMPADMRTFWGEGILTPVFDSFLGALSTVAGPMIFLSVAWGIYSIGDTATLGVIGKKMMLRFTGATFLLTAVSVVMSLPFFKVNMSVENMDGSQLGSVFQMLLDIIPENIVQPFAEGNSMQIIVIAAAVGIAMLILGEQTVGAAKLVEQADYIVQYIMEFISSIVPFFIFVSLLQMMLSDSLAQIAGAWKPIAVYVLLILVLLAGVLLYVSLKERINFILLVRKLFPTFLIALTTASSSAAFGTNMSCCEEKLGINSRIANFGLPLGIVMYMPGSAVNFLVVGMYMAESYQTEINLSWMLTAILLSGILAIATPPIPGGGLTCYTVMFLQLGIPEEALALTMTLDLIFDFMATAASQTFLQAELILQADKLELLNRNVLQESN